MSEMTTPNFPPCPVCRGDVKTLEGYGARTFVEPCGHPVLATFNAGGVQGAVVLQRAYDTPPAQPGS